MRLYTYMPTFGEQQKSNVPNTSGIASKRPQMQGFVNQRIFFGRSENHAERSNTWSLVAVVIRFGVRVFVGKLIEENARREFAV